MLEFKQTDTVAPLIVTLTEKVTINDPYFLFVFTHILTKQVVSFIKSEAQDESDYPERFNQFTINPAVVFLSKQIGMWLYTIYQQASSSNTDTTLTQGVLEYGKMIMERDPAFAYTIYDEPTTIKAYNG